MIEPIVTRKQMIDLLNDVCMSRVPVVEALAWIEQWGDDFAARNIHEWKLRNAKGCGLSSLPDTPRIQ